MLDEKAGMSFRVYGKVWSAEYHMISFVSPMKSLPYLQISAIEWLEGFNPFDRCAPSPTNGC